MTTWDMKIENGTIVTDTEQYKANIYIREGKISAVTHEQLTGDSLETIDATGHYVFPGFIDTHIHSRDPGPTYKEDFIHSTRAAAAGGITTVFEMPNTSPPVNHAENFDRQVENLSKKAFVDFALWGICVGDLNNQHLPSLQQKGVIGFKFFWGYAVHAKTYQLMYNYKPGMEDVIPPFQDGDVYTMMQEVQKTGEVFAVHAENNDLIQTLTEKVEARGGKSYEDLIATRPALAEVLTVKTGIELARETGVRFHVLHISSGDALDLIRDAQAEGLPITVETCPHYLFLSNEDFARVGPHMKVYPPVKYKSDQERIWQGITDGTISHVCSDHAPHTEEEKNGGLWSIPAGMCGVETLVPLMLQGVTEGKLSLQDVARLLSVTPAKLFGVHPQKGCLTPGSDADITIVDMNKERTIDREQLHSKSKVTAYHGKKIKGWPVQTIVRGQMVMNDGKLFGKPGQGKLITKKRKQSLPFN
ncbi:allantoinase AllB [Geomicrobium sediminis]|uniref:allantoinase n=1 Tax=Geomicrobium sediminis TaxID=1347788 RepID=A0ABS2PCJ8_9BACL|nr:allantoinase AllB [Geomicrobium sediminis]MBM7632836.1 dihydroorotase/allantoinase [Geomicrobium sediminis]